jgi:hypothetical protein
MRKDRDADWLSTGTRSKAMRIPTVAELAKRMSELLHLRDRVEKAERSGRPTATPSRRSFERSISIK